MNSNSIKITYIGGGSRGWAWNLMSDLAMEPDLQGEVCLYDIDREAARVNEAIGNRIGHGGFRYRAEDEIGKALTGADFVIISILPGTFDEMQSDVHLPEEYGIYQSVGDTAGPGGIVRAMRTIPMYVEIAQAIEKYAPEAWVINYTNPMTMCMDTLYSVFPKIKAFGCCHEVFGTQKVLGDMVTEMLGAEDPKRSELKVNVKGINHFTWIDRASYHGIDLMPLYKQYVEKYGKTGVAPEQKPDPEEQAMFSCRQMVKFDLFSRFGVIAAAGDRHLAEFCPGYWYLKDPETVKRWGFGLTTVAYRKRSLQDRLKKSHELASGARQFELNGSGEEGVMQIKAILGMGDIVTNVNLPNRGQIANMPAGRIVETNAHFTSGSVTPVVAGPLPDSIHGRVTLASDNFRVVVESCLKRDLNGCFKAFTNDSLVAIPVDRAEELFTRMIKNTEKYLTYYK